MPYSIFVLGSAGSGKSTLVQNIVNYAALIGRRITPVNLDPSITTSFSIDITHHITTQETMESEGLGPNGAIIHSLQMFLDEFSIDDDEFYIFDCPGQIELLMSSDILTNFVKQMDGSKCLLYIADAVNNKELSSVLCGLICAVRFNVPVINIASKVDLISESQLQEILEMGWLHETVSGGLTGAMSQLIIDNGYDSIIPVSWDNEDLICNVLYSADMSLQYYDDCEPKETMK